ncbi:hypothetical protein L3V79_04020 [Thiotrichales bacterium 19S9-12]|nr:hypothetical protein [Thiotrichales bacterium 19S9-11]MCF6811524.1 hypothetical protein [Thiotrichales bacterium 19S9-12]
MAYLYQLNSTNNRLLPYSHLYYCYRKVFDEHKLTQLLLVESLHYQLIKTAWFYKDRDIATQKLLWWHQELEKMYQNNATHPLIKEMLSASFSDKAKKLSIDLSNIALAWLVSGEVAYNFFSLESQLVGYFLTLDKLKAEILSESVDLLSLNLLSTNCALAHYVYYLPELIQRNILMPSDQYLADFNINFDQLKRYDKTINLTPWLLSVGRCIANNMSQIKQMPRQNKKELGPILANAKLWQALFFETKKNKFNIFQHRIVLSPLKMLIKTAI